MDMGMVCSIPRYSEFQYHAVYSVVLSWNPRIPECDPRVFWDVPTEDD